MKKILYILLALGLLLGMTVVATPAAADVSSATVLPGVGSSLTECGCSNWTVMFDTNLALSQYQKVYIRFPAGTDLTKTVPCGAVNVSLWGYNPITAAYYLVPSTFNVIPYGDLTQQVHITLNAGQTLPAGHVMVLVHNVLNPPAGTYTLKCSTEREPTEVNSSSFTIIAGPTISPTSTVWCNNSCQPIWFLVNWGSSCANDIVAIQTNLGCSLGWVKTDIALGVSNVTIDCANLTACNLSACGNTFLVIDFQQGCNVTLALTVADFALVTMVPGWNLISLPLIPLNSDIDFIFGFLNATEAKKVLSVWYWENACQADGTGNWLVYKDGTGFQSLTTMDACKAYWVCINSTSNVTLPICGFHYPCPPAVPPKCCYCECWNMVGYKSLNSTMTLGQYTASLPAGTLQGVLTFQGGWVVVGNNTAMTPGLGYWMAFAKDACIVPPLS